MPSKKVVLDTNLWISFLITKDYSKLDKLLFTNKCSLVFSDELLMEFVTVANRPKFKKYFTKVDVETIIETIEKYATFVKVTSEVTLCRDSKDNFLLSLALDGKADYLVTGDADLLALERIEMTEITTITSLLEKF
jgi:putative PIN family toxin of toxin-antitoxin system